MKCKTCKEQIVLGLYGELTPSERRRLERHLEGCADCARDAAYTREVFNLIQRSEAGGVPEAAWERCWSRITDGIRTPDRPLTRTWKLPRWAPAAAAVVLVFAIGLFLGRFWPRSQPSAAQGTARSEGFDGMDLRDHFESIKPILAEYANQPADAAADGQVPVDRGLIHSLLVQNFMLMRMVAQNDPDAAELLEDIDLVLREIKNMESGDPGAPAMIRSLIRQRDILFKIDVLQTL